MDPKNFQNGGPNLPKSSPNWAKWGQDAVRTAKKSKPNAYLTKKTRASNAAPPFYPKKWPTWPQVGSQVGAKMEKKSMQKSIKKLMPPGIGFWKDFGGFWEGKWSQVGTKMGSKIDVNFERPIL